MLSGYCIRAFRAEDEPALLALAQSAFERVNAPYVIEQKYDVPGLGREVNEAAFRKHLRRTEDILVAAGPDSSPAGYAALEVDEKAGYGTLDYLTVFPEHRRVGLGRAMVEESLQHFRRQRLRAAFTGYDAHNAVAGNLYRSFGFTELRVLRYYCARPSCALDDKAVILEPIKPEQIAIRPEDRALLLDHLIARKHGLRICVEGRRLRWLREQSAQAHLFVSLPDGSGGLLCHAWCAGRAVEVAAILAASAEAEEQLFKSLRSIAARSVAVVIFLCADTRDEQRTSALAAAEFAPAHDLVQLSCSL